MSKEAITESVRAGKLIIPRNKFSDFAGLLPLFALWVICAITLRNTDSDWSRRAIPAFIIAGMVFFYAVYCLSRERDLVGVKTGLNAAANRALLASAYNILGWRISQNEKGIVSASLPSKWFVNFWQNATALIQDEIVLLNVMHDASASGRSPFSYGANKNKLDDLIKTINILLLQGKGK